MFQWNCKDVRCWPPIRECTYHCIWTSFSNNSNTWRFL